LETSIGVVESGNFIGGTFEESLARDHWNVIILNSPLFVDTDS